VLLLTLLQALLLLVQTCRPADQRDLLLGLLLLRLLLLAVCCRR
jgi:hypothetical protein